MSVNTFLLPKGCKLHYFYEKKRVVALVYCISVDWTHVRYGASIYQLQNEVLCNERKRILRSIALRRFQDHSVSVNAPFTFKQSPVWAIDRDDILFVLRNLVHTHGVCTRRTKIEEIDQVDFTVKDFVGYDASDTRFRRKKKFPVVKRFELPTGCKLKYFIEKTRCVAMVFSTVDSWKSIKYGASIQRFDSDPSNTTSTICTTSTNNTNNTNTDSTRTSNMKPRLRVTALERYLNHPVEVLTGLDGPPVWNKDADKIETLLRGFIRSFGVRVRRKKISTPSKK